MSVLDGSSGVEAVFFDAVGTLIHPDPAAAIVYAQVARRFGSRLTVTEIEVRFREAFLREERLDEQQGWRTSEERERERWQRIVRAVLDDVADAAACFADLWDHFGKAAAWRCEPDLPCTLQELRKRGCVLGLASNYDHRLRSVLAGMPDLAAVPHVIISSEIGWRKPASEFYRAIAHRTGRPVSRILMVGDDRVNDFDGARNAGMQAILFDSSRKALTAGVPRIGRLAELVMGGDPNSELVDVIDDEGRTVGTVTRREMRQRHLLHRCVYLLVFDRQGQLFIHLRTPTKDVYPGCWDVAVGGVLAAGETFDQGVRRELAEELGIEATPEPLFPFRYRDAATMVQAMAYRVTHSGPFRLQPEEIVRGEFVSLGELPARTARDPFCPDGLAVLAEYAKCGLGL